MKYKYIGTDKQLKKHGFTIDSEDSRFKSAYKDLDTPNGLYIAIGDYAFGDKNIITFDNYNRDKDNIKPYIQDLIDANLVEVIKQ